MILNELGDFVPFLKSKNGTGEIQEPQGLQRIRGVSVPFSKNKNGTPKIQEYHSLYLDCTVCTYLF